MTESEFMQTEEYRAQKRQVYFGYVRVPWNIKDMGDYAHKKAMEYYNKNLKNEN